MRAAATFLMLLIPRLCIPVSFLLSIVLAPIAMLSGILDWPRHLRAMWDDPL